MEQEDMFLMLMGAGDVSESRGHTGSPGLAFLLLGLKLDMPMMITHYRPLA